MRIDSSCTALALVGLLVGGVTACVGHIARRDGSEAAQNTTASAFQVKVFPRPRRTKTALVNVRPFNGYTLDPLTTIYFDGDYIVEAGGDDDVDYTVDGLGAVLLPGLIDSHCHPMSYEQLELLSGWGVTTGISMACSDYTKCSALHDTVGLADYVTAGQPAQGPGSAHAIAQGTPANRLISSASQAPAFVEENFANGAQFLKITAEEDGPDQATQNALVVQAHARGRYTATHAATYDYYIMAVESKSNGMQHMPYDQLLNSSTLDMMVAQNQWATPTMGLYNRFLSNPAALTVLGESASPNFNLTYGTVEANVAAVHAKGVPVLAGTDSNDGGNYPLMVPFGQSLHEELEHFVAVGFTPAEALRAATLVPSLAQRLRDRGSLAPGKRADLLLLQPGADPLRNISHTQMISRVWIKGIEYAGPINGTSPSSGLVPETRQSGSPYANSTM